ncbi:hypothetical protein G3I28_16540 [Streptomyces sp. SID10116]|nr:hypothetical protein [Streptomyces sp. SID10116]
MDACDLAATAARALSAAMSGATTTAVSDLVRNRLSRSVRGRSVLEELAHAPEDPDVGGRAHQMDDPTARRDTRILSLSSLLADRLEEANGGKPG